MEKDSLRSIIEREYELLKKEGEREQRVFDLILIFFVLVLVLGMIVNVIYLIHTM